MSISSSVKALWVYLQVHMRSALVSICVPTSVTPLSYNQLYVFVASERPSLAFCLICRACNV